MQFLRDRGVGSTLFVNFASLSIYSPRIVWSPNVQQRIFTEPCFPSCNIIFSNYTQPLFKSSNLSSSQATSLQVNQTSLQVNQTSLQVKQPLLIVTRDLLKPCDLSLRHRASFKVEQPLVNSCKLSRSNVSSPREQPTAISSTRAWNSQWLHSDRTRVS